jgi:ferredoxin
MISKQKDLHDMPNMLLPSSNSPSRVEIPLEMLELLETRSDIRMRHSFPIRILFSILKNILYSIDSMSENPPNPSTNASEEIVNQIKEFAKSLGVGPIGFVKLPRDLIFQEYGVLYDDAIILAMEMNMEKINNAPSQDTMDMVFETYDDLGIAANKITELLREHGYAAQADHPLGGLALFPPLAQKAGIGWIGKHGILITPEFGPRIRLAAIYTSIQNLPYDNTNPHSWISEYCENCRLCIEKCPAKAILDDPIKQDSGRMTYISKQPCFEYFTQFYCCSVCIKVCPFSKSVDAYDKLRSTVESTGNQ